MRLLPLDLFAPIFQPLQGKWIGYVPLPGNLGDKLIEMATFQLLELFSIDFSIQDSLEESSADELIIAGGGNMGTLYECTRRVRIQALALSKPITILPQTFNAAENLGYSRVYVREKQSLFFRPDAILAPDLGLGFDYSSSCDPTEPIGIWLRKDKEGLFQDKGEGDPIEVCQTVQEYLDLAGKYCHLVTDRLHFAIAGLLQGREVTLLPNSYHKNRSMWDTWLKVLGCKWADNPNITKPGCLS